MAIQTAPSATIIFFCLLAFTTQQASAFSVSSPCIKRERTEQQRIWASSDSVQQNSVRLFAEAGDSAVKAADKKDDEKKEAEIPTDPAKTTPEFLAGLWRLIAQGNDMVRGESKTVLFPEMGDKMITPRFLNLVTAHLDSCKDVCDYFGISTTLQPFVKGGRVQGFTIKSFRNPDKDPNNMEFDYDPFWDEADDWDYEGIDAEYEKEEAEENGEDASKPKVEYPEIVDKIPDNDEEIEKLSKDWVAKICSDMGVCPFTSGASMAGLPMGPVYYTTDRSSSFEDMYRAYWEEVVRVEGQSEKDLSTTLLIAPEFCMDNIELFETWSTTLTQPLSALGIEDIIQLVFFHPHWVFRDGGERGGEGAAANYARRSPWPMINILRTNQVRAAQKGIPTGLVYKQNEKTLSGVGVEKLETMLRLRDWTEIADVKVDRREMEALRVAQDIQESGVVKQQDASFANDATPAVNKVDGNQIEQGDLVNVMMEAVKKRLGNGEGGDGIATRLTGPETSAAIMASDFLLAELDKIAKPPEEEEEETETGGSESK
mmetsp:Transcript_93128/g.189730  ORF Transcript_93128/g.189730 Transcript_93128/m.189730 type:complete len:543 (+) Transcript_93128:142-1770(+)|eukprot:CAMPEP_0201186476 /NCGR_PEP_ID=MMETSP0851-20130426/131335_1 /ASSEMBLY_ACC=CAM_ASM_000631 /TAXON_ID=183588 /ORGANISM="Pseudo-nitzschia fraudulenta, Strain WWA7" /LENGTH=542 /DNA_ID=CAMNT_0047471775 /DNA_START=141 /DNA_END=1769 /DNA_ORIENTATION=-